MLRGTCRLFKRGVKKGLAKAVSFLFQKKSYSLFGIPWGLVSYDEEKQELYSSPSEEAGVLLLKEGMATSLGGNLDVQRRLVSTYLIPLDGKPPAQHDLFHFTTRRFFPKIYRTSETVVALTAGWQGAFYHWMYEVLPRLHLIEKSAIPFHKIYVETCLPFQKESLELLGISREVLINAQEYQGVAASQILIPSINPTPTFWGCQFLREKFLPQLKKGKMRLYVSRRDASRRRIENEEEIWPLLERYGFQRVELSRLSFKEQMEYFAGAEMVVGPHGAGFSHLVFCPPGAVVIEIFSPKYLHSCYRQVAGHVGLRYFQLLGKEHRMGEQDPDIVVGPAKLETLLHTLLP